MIPINNQLKDKLNKIPELPGIYKMLDSRGHIIYIGKSKCLKKRVKSYFVSEPKWEKVKKMVNLIKDIEYLVTDTHLEARLLECKLIKTIKPAFNSQMKNDSRYAYLEIRDYNPYNPLAVVNQRTDQCYGPFRSKHILIKSIDLLKNIYPIREQDDHYNFQYHLFPITMDRDCYLINQKLLNDLFNHDQKLDLFIQDLEKEMQKEASNYRFEAASYYRDLIHGLQYVKAGINGYRDLFSKNLLLKIPTKDGVKLFYVTRGNIILDKKYQILRDQSLRLFIEKGNQLQAKQTEVHLLEKSAIDYRDIIYSEINSLPKEMVIDLSEL
jgi:excinuclease ABC subunit C